MNSRTVGMLALGVAVAFGIVSCEKNSEQAAPAADAPPAVATCDRACLLGVVDKYVAALVKKDPEQAPFASDARFTENAQVLELGDGLWNTASEGPQGYKLVAADPTNGQAGFYMLMKESGNPIWLSGRLKVVDQKITELETVIIRKNASGFGNFERTAPLPVWDEVLEPAQRRPRAAMIDIANKYFEALEKNLADAVPFDDQCNRIENGVQTTNNTSLHFGGDGPNVGALSCRENINSMMWRYITLINPRRFLIVDEERGIVMGVFMFHQDGSNLTTTVPGFGEYKYSAQTLKPFTTVIPEMFKIRDGKIVQIEATMASIPYGSKSRWDDRS